jgi:alpha-1,6-mannosyltransferase
MLMVGVMMAGIALTLDRHPIAGVAVVGLAVAVKATAGVALPFLVWVWMRQMQQRRAMSPTAAFASAAAGSVAVFGAVFGALSWIAGVDLGWLSALAGSVKIINWLTPVSRSRWWLSCCSCPPHCRGTTRGRWP